MLKKKAPPKPAAPADRLFRARRNALRYAAKACDNNLALRVRIDYVFDTGEWVVKHKLITRK